MARLRTFIALDLSSAIRDRLVSLQEKLAGGGAKVKWVEPENLHITLLFLGEVDQRAVVDICRAVSEAASGVQAFSLTMEGAGAFPNVRRPRIVWAGVGAGAAEVCALHDALEKPLLELGCYRREERKFTPHVTLGRIRNEQGSPSLEGPLRKLEKWKGGETTIQEVHVMSSELTREGPVYTVLSRARLSGRDA